LDTDKNSTHKGETRETRIKEFHFVEKIPVLGLREGSWLKIVDGDISLGGKLTARLFLPGEEAREISSEEDLSFLLS
jgi:dipeptidase E